MVSLTTDSLFKDSFRLKHEEVIKGGRKYDLFSSEQTRTQWTIAKSQEIFNTALVHISELFKIKSSSKQAFYISKDSILKSVCLIAHGFLKKEKADSNKYKDLIKARDLTCNFFRKAPDVSSSFSHLQYAEWVEKEVSDHLNFILTPLGIEVSEKPVKYSEDDCKTFEIEEKEIVVDPSLLTCASYTFLKLKELKAKDRIFFIYDDTLLDNILDYLAGWNYVCVSKPAVNDLVVYFDNNEPSHMGIYLGKGMVHSKFGTDNPYVQTHGIFEVPDTYGNQVMFFRKK